MPGCGQPSDPSFQTVAWSRITTISSVAAPLINTLLALGEELGWRGLLLPELLPLGQRRAILLSGVIWGFWHAPVILQGHNYPSQPVLGVFLMWSLPCAGRRLFWLALPAHTQPLGAGPGAWLA